MIALKKYFLDLVLLSAISLCLTCNPKPEVKRQLQTGWPSVTRENKPWTRWWWHGSAVTKEGLTAEMEAYQRAGIGGLEITPIYGVVGAENQFVNYLSPEWMQLLLHVLKEAERLDLGIDMATGTGWPFGGPWVSGEDACKNLQYKIYEVNGGSTLNEKIEFIQQPYLRVIGTRLGGRGEAENSSKNIQITDVVDPIEHNKDLQALAAEQVQFQKQLKLKCLMAYSPGKQPVDLTSSIDTSGKLRWTAGEGSWKLYAVFEGFHGKMVERAGPGGEGNVIDHFSKSALTKYLAHFDEAINSHDISSLRAFFNDSYEVDDARGAADFTPALFDEFKSRRGYDLRNELPALFGNDADEKNKRVLSDYRETISELLLDNFTRQWKEWANQQHGALVRNQAHGSPANILDLYATVDIPEIEGTEPLRFKMATSSGNVSGKKLISAEAATWLNEHFESSLADIKGALDKFMLHGVNHLFYHGTCYSPPGEPWPGRLFYAAVHMNPRNPLWRDAAKLNSYVTGCQSFLQRAVPDNDVLLYYPVYDRFAERGSELIEHFDGIGAFEGTSFARCAQQMLGEGYAFDYISDKQILETKFQDGKLITSGNVVYKTVVIPACNYMPLKTLEKLSSLAESGANIIFIDKGPRAVSGYSDFETSSRRFAEVRDRMKEDIHSGTDLRTLIGEAGVKRERMVDAGIHCIRKRNPAGGWIYFINNSTREIFEGLLPLSVAVEGMMLFDPMTGTSGKGRMKQSSSGTEVYVRLDRAQSLILESYSSPIEVPNFPYIEFTGAPLALTGQWKMTFDSGGPELPPPNSTALLMYWTDLKLQSYKDFSGTATYELTFDKPAGDPKRWLLKLDSVKESAEVVLNGQSIGTLIGPVYQLELDSGLLKDRNVLQIRVSNLMANRIAYMDRSNIFWKKFYNVNFPSRLRENSREDLFTAAHWKPRPSGLMGKIQLFPLR